MNLTSVMAEIAPHAQAISATKHSGLDHCMEQQLERDRLLTPLSIAVQWVGRSGTGPSVQPKSQAKFDPGHDTDERQHAQGQSRIRTRHLDASSGAVHIVLVRKKRLTGWKQGHTP